MSAAEGRLVVCEPALAPGVVVGGLEIAGRAARFGESVPVEAGSVTIAVEGTACLPRLGASWRLAIAVEVAAGAATTVDVRWSPVTHQPREAGIALARLATGSAEYVGRRT